MSSLIMKNSRCSKIVFSNKSFLGIIAETYERSNTETGGILLGSIVGDTWYVLESLDPGPNSIFEQSYFEYDTPYVTHLANKIARFYQVKLQLLGLWHRHPGSFDSFSSTDDSTNREYALKNSIGAISGLVNLDPDFRLTMYHVFCPSNSQLRPQYRKVSSIRVGDEEIPSSLLSFKNPEDYFPKKLSHRGKSLKPNSPRKNFWKNIWPNNQSKQSHRESLTREVPHNSAVENQFKSRAEEFLDFMLDTIDPELSYLDSQIDYDYDIHREKNKIKINMKYVGKIHGYPHFMKWTFYCSEDNAVLAKLDDDQITLPYQPNIILNYINKSINTISY